MLHRNLADVQAYLVRRLPGRYRPEWLVAAIAELLFYNPEWRLVEEPDLFVGAEILSVEFREGDQLDRFRNGVYGFRGRMSDPATEVRGGTNYMFWNDDRGGCARPVGEGLLLGEAWPTTCVEMPHEVMLVKKADPGRTLLEQMVELRVQSKRFDGKRCPECGIAGRIMNRDLGHGIIVRDCMKCHATF